MLFIFLWFELCKILPENSHNPIILQYKYDKLKEKNAPLIDEENEDSKKKKKFTNFLHKAVYILQKRVYLSSISSIFFLDYK